MQPKNRTPYLYLYLGAGLVIGWLFLQNYLWPPVPRQREATPNELGLLGGTVMESAIEAGIPELVAAEQALDMPGLVSSSLYNASARAGIFGEVAAARRRDLPGLVGGGAVTGAIAVDAPRLVALERRKEFLKNAPSQELIPMGQNEKPFHLQVMLNSKGASIQQVVLSDFMQADREGLEVKLPDGKPQSLHLIPGVKIPRTAELREQRKVEVPTLVPGKVLEPAILDHPSYVLYHYAKPNDLQPVDTLGERIWKIVRNETLSDGNTQEVAFETEIEDPHYVRITKIFTLSRGDYHVGMRVVLTPLPKPEGKKATPFQYQIAGPRSIQIEGEWYTTTYRQGVVCWNDDRGHANRTLEMAQQVRFLDGSDKLASTDAKPIRYAGVMVQYFASVLALDNQQPEGQAANYIQYVRFTPQGATHENKTFLDDLTFRAVSKDITLEGKPVTHSYLLYQGPVKVRLLKQLEGEKEVPEETVNRYRDDLHLNLLTDAPMPNFLGRFANFIFWSDIVIVFTNLVHSLLGLLSHLVPNLAISVILITFMVRGLLHPFSRRQMLNAKIMQEKQAKLAPEVKKLTEKYGEDFHRLNQEKMKLFKEHGIHPTAAMGGCFLVLAQMPIFMGLYYALQESVFLRLESFLWIPNLAAPDMLAWWTEKIPFLSRPEDLGASLYLGPYLNILPLIAVALMLYTQTKMMPKSDDPQIQMQQKMMKFMMIFFALFFYKVAAGLCIYFICSSVWGMIERRMLPKTLPQKATLSPSDKDREPIAPAAPTGWLGKKMATWRERWEQILEDAQKQQQLQRENRPIDRGKKKKKR